MPIISQCNSAMEDMYSVSVKLSASIFTNKSCSAADFAELCGKVDRN